MVSEVLNKPIEDFNISVRLYSCCRQNNIKTLGELAKTPEYKILRTHGVGRKTINEAKILLATYGLHLNYSSEEEQEAWKENMVSEVRCDECKAMFLFKAITIVNDQPERNFPMFCPYCGRSSNRLELSDYRTTFSVATATRF